MYVSVFCLSLFSGSIFLYLSLHVYIFIIYRYNYIFYMYIYIKISYKLIPAHSFFPHPTQHPGDSFSSDTASTIYSHILSSISFQAFVSIDPSSCIFHPPDNSMAGLFHYSDASWECGSSKAFPDHTTLPSFPHLPVTLFSITSISFTAVAILWSHFCVFSHC